MGIAQTNNAQIYKHNGITSTFLPQQLSHIATCN